MQQQGVAPEEIHLTLDVRPYIDRKLASMLCHQTQIGPDWPFYSASHEVVADVLGEEYLLRAYPPVPHGTPIPADVFAGICPEDDGPDMA
jgi:hypothetical protein